MHWGPWATHYYQRKSSAAKLIRGRWTRKNVHTCEGLFWYATLYLSLICLLPGILKIFLNEVELLLHPVKLANQLNHLRMNRDWFWDLGSLLWLCSCVIWCIAATQDVASSNPFNYHIIFYWIERIVQMSFRENSNVQIFYGDFNTLESVTLSRG